MHILWRLIRFFRRERGKEVVSLALGSLTEDRLLGRPLHKFDVGRMNGHVPVMFQ